MRQREFVGWVFKSDRVYLDNGRLYRVTSYGMFKDVWRIFRWLIREEK